MFLAVLAAAKHSHLLAHMFTVSLCSISLVLYLDLIQTYQKVENHITQEYFYTLSSHENWIIITKFSCKYSIRYGQAKTWM